MMDIIKQCMENGESYVFRQKFNNLFSKEEFNHLLNLRPFTTVSRFLPTKRNKRLETYKALTSEQKREPWVKSLDSIPPSIIEEVIRTCVCYWPDCSRVNKQINDLCFELEELSGENCDAHIFFAIDKKLENSFGAHYDEATNLIVQVEGRTHWKVCTDKVNTDEVPPNVKDIDKYGVGIDTILNPGDAIFIPKHVLHEPKNLTSRISVSFPMKSRQPWLTRPNQRQDRKWLEVDFT